MPKVTPMLHVPDVDATLRWYESIGFSVRDRGYEDEKLVWGVLALGGSELMLSIGGAPSEAHRREVDLYITTDEVEEIATRLHGKVDVVEPLHDTFYGMRELIIRDCNRFWITFGQPIASR